MKRLELSGFKSFAKTTVLEFPSRITAIVGPNGSGKSNIAEAVRWVLGEQSMKSLRGKKGEDLIWNGSPQIARMGKASVSLLFDNSNGRIPIEFGEVILGRKIFRDGSNEYSLNQSPVRLKDVAELMARVGLGETKHNIIAQGEVDRALLASPRERREMLEEALGLRVYHLKKGDAERKLAATGQNMGQTEALIRELAPHLKFLRSQVKRAEARERIGAELRESERVWIAREREAIEREERETAARYGPLLARHAVLREEIGRLEKEIAATEGDSQNEKETAPAGMDAAPVSRRQALEREIGRLEGKLEAELEKAGSSEPRRAASMNAAAEEVRAALAEIRTLLEEERDLESARPHLLALTEDIDRALDAAESGAAPMRRGILGGAESGAIREIEHAIRSLQEELERIGKEVAAGEILRRKELDAARKARENLRSLDAALRKKKDEEREIVLSRERLKFDETRIRERREEFMREVRTASVEEADLSAAAVLDPKYAAVSQGELRRKIERLRARLEEAGGIDEAVAKEYEAAEARYLFLTKELEDLRQATASLRALVKELDGHIKKDFKEGLAKIKEEFHNYFRIIFGGGAARLRITKQESTIKEDALEEEAGEENGEGVEIGVDLPRKRIHGLAMLSGGERALTATALLFAITAVNPPPFLVLDETDAALDEANSRRYANILGELAKKTQLILVTHNRETMKCAGVLYGVTMGDDGVSRLLSLKLGEAEEYTDR